MPLSQRILVESQRPFWLSLDVEFARSMKNLVNVNRFGESGDRHATFAREIMLWMIGCCVGRHIGGLSFGGTHVRFCS